MPTEAEWEWAARNGAEGTEFPWGNEAPNATLLNACGAECPPNWMAKMHEARSTLYDGDDGWPETAPVGSFPGGKNRWGVLDLVGNVWEWTTSLEGTDLVYRGGDWLGDDRRIVNATYRITLRPSSSGYFLGARCVKTP